MESVVVLSESKSFVRKNKSRRNAAGINRRIGENLLKWRMASGRSLSVAARRFNVSVEFYLACELGTASMKASQFAAGIQLYGVDVAFEGLMLINELMRDSRAWKEQERCFSLVS